MSLEKKTKKQRNFTDLDVLIAFYFTGWCNSELKNQSQTEGSFFKSSVRLQFLNKV